MDLSGACNVGYDVADDGGDRNCSVRFDGGICVELDAWKAGEDEILKSTLRAFSMFDGSGVFSYDSIGVGASVGSILKDKGLKGYSKFNAGAEVFNPDREYAPKITNKKKFENLKAQAWQDVADRFRSTFNAVTKGHKVSADKLISISSDLHNLEALKFELSAVHRDYSKRGLDMVESKKDVKKRLERSHDLADAFIMGACPHLVKRERAIFSGHGF
jgi:phage terminase large subunit